MKMEKHYAENNQEDEDGYSLYPRKAITREKKKNNQPVSSGVNKENKEVSKSKMIFR